jgi:hypothetical protein
MSQLRNLLRNQEVTGHPRGTAIIPDAKVWKATMPDGETAAMEIRAHLAKVRAL